MSTDRKTLTPAKGIAATVVGPEDQMLLCWHRYRQKVETIPAILVLYVFTADEDTSYGQLQLHWKVQRMHCFWTSTSATVYSTVSNHQQMKTIRTIFTAYSRKYETQLLCMYFIKMHKHLLKDFSFILMYFTCKM